MGICNNCGAAFNEGAKYCGRCGTRLILEQMPQYSGGYAVPNGPSCELFKHNQLVVGEKYHGLRAESNYIIYTTDGTEIGTILQKPLSNGENFAQISMRSRGSKLLFSSSFSVYNERAEYVGGFCQTGLTRQMFDQYNRLIGTIDKGHLRDANGQPVVLYKFNSTKELDVFYLDGRKFAAITKEWNGARQCFADMDKYLIDLDPGATELCRLLGILYCINLELIH